MSSHVTPVMPFSPYPAVEAKLGQRKRVPRFFIQNPVKVSQSGKDPPAAEGVGFFLKNTHHFNKTGNDCIPGHLYDLAQ